MKRKTTWIKALGSHFSFSVVLVVAVSGPLLCFDGDSPAAPAASITVMTRNLYVGASFGILAGALTPNEAADRVAQVYEKILSSQFSRRAEAIAEEIVQTRPDVVGLQEAPLLIVQ